MIKLWYVYVNLGERSFLSKHVRKNEVPLIADFVLDLFQLWYMRTQNNKGIVRAWCGVVYSGTCMLVCGASKPLVRRIRAGLGGNYDILK